MPNFPENDSKQTRNAVKPSPLTPKQLEFVQLLGELLAELWHNNLAGVDHSAGKTSEILECDAMQGNLSPEKIVRNSLSFRAAPHRRHAAARKTPRLAK